MSFTCLHHCFLGKSSIIQLGSMTLMSRRSSRHHGLIPDYLHSQAARYAYPLSTVRPPEGKRAKKRERTNKSHRQKVHHHLSRLFFFSFYFSSLPGLPRAPNGPITHHARKKKVFSSSGPVIFPARFPVPLHYDIVGGSATRLALFCLMRDWRGLGSRRLEHDPQILRDKTSRSTGRNSP